MNAKILKAVLAFISLNSLAFTPAALAQDAGAGERPAAAFGLVSALDPAVIGPVDLERYAGLWYEIASIPLSFQSFCQRTTAEYAVIGPGRISVANRCSVGFVPVNIFGEATVVDQDTGGILEVGFKFNSRKGDYRIVALAEDYSYAAVTNADRSSFFVLSRAKTLDQDVYDALLDRAAAIGVDVSQVRLTQQ